MKLKKIMLICILLAILAIGTASAADDTTDKISCEDTVAADFTNQMSSGDEAILEENENTDMGIDVLGAENPETIGGCPDDARENLSIETDGVNNENSSSDDKYAATAEPEMLNAEPAFETKVIFVGEDLFLEYYKSDNIDTSNLPFFDYDEAVTEEYLINGNFSKVDFEINGTTYYAYPADFYDLGGSCTYVWYYVPTKTLPCGNYAAKLKFSNESYRMYNLSVIAYSIGTEENRTDWLYGINDYISFVYSNNLTGYIKVNVNSNMVYNKSVDYKAQMFSDYAKQSVIRLSEFLEWGNNEVLFEYYGGNYPNCTKKFNVTFTYTLGVENMTDVLVMQPYYYFFEAPKTLSINNLTVMIDGVGCENVDYDTYTFLTGYVDISKLKVGNHSVVVSYEGDERFYPLTERACINITSKIEIPDTVVNGKNEIIITSLGKNDKVELSAESDYDFYDLSVKLVNGKAKVSLAKLNGGEYYISVYDFGQHLEYSTLVIVKNTRLTAKDMSMYYKSGSSFKVKVETSSGKIVKNKYVKFYINGKFVKKVKTNKNGVAALKIGKSPGKYKIKVVYDKVQITRKLTVKHVVSLKAAAVKKSAKKLTLKATLKQGKKALKNKKVTFKFNGKTYKAKTNKKGVATVTVKKAVLKKLKVGKTVKYQATYLKDTVKKSAKVKK